MLRIENLSKYFAGNRALESVSLGIEPGQVHLLVGQNGSGKSTLIKVLAGYHMPERGGTIEVGGVPLRFGHPDHAYRLGCRFVHQDLALVADATVVDNLYVGGRYPMRFGCIDTRLAARRAREMLSGVGLDIPVRAKVTDLSASQRAGVAIARALRPDPAFGVRVLVLDEPTATLPANEVDHLVKTVRAAAAQGVAILYVTHHMNEAFQVGDVVTVLRDGVVVHSGPMAGISEQQVITHLTGAGEQRAASRPGTRRPADGAAISVRQLSAPSLRDVTFDVGSGEVVGVAGITGSGRETLLEVMFGARKRDGGQVLVDGEPVPPDRPDRAIARGVALLPSDRKSSGSFAGLSAEENLTILGLSSFWRGLRMRRREERSAALSWFDRLDVRPPTATRKPFSTFSGGNQQKILFAKWLSRAPRVLLLDEPTQGVDVGAKARLHAEIIRVAASGTPVVVSSTELEELVAICGRVLVLRGGRITRIVTGDELTVATLTEAVLSASA
jgi:ribose transport system ATP-binding protein